MKRHVMPLAAGALPCSALELVQVFVVLPGKETDDLVDCDLAEEGMDRHT